MPICEVPEGGRFAIPGLDMKAGVVLRQSFGGTTVRYDGRHEKAYQGREHGEEVAVSFSAPNQPLQISGGTEVVQL